MMDVKKKYHISLSVLSIILPVMTGGMLLLFFLFLYRNPNYLVQKSRADSDFFIVRDISCREVEDKDTPIGIRKEYYFTIKEGLEKDSSLAFYTVHQYVEILIDNRLVYSLKPSGKLPMKTIGSNWTIIPLYREDAGKEIHVNIIPVYESFRNREVEFLVGSEFAICADRFSRDWPQLLLSLLAILLGIIFGGISVYQTIHKKSDDGMLALGLFTLMAGVWRLTDTRFTPFFASDKPVLMFYISVSMLMIGIVPLIKSVESQFHKTSRRILDGYCIFTSIVCMIQILIQFFGDTDFREQFYIIHGMIGFGATVFLGVVIYEKIKHPKKQREILRSKAALILVAGALADIAAFYIKGNSSGLLFSLTALLIYATTMGVKMMLRYVEQEKQLAEKNRILGEQAHQLAESWISTMISQIRPHFIYNTLGSIEELCELSPEDAKKMVHSFSCYLRGNFNELDNPAPVPFSKEIEHCRYYVSIEKVRFPDITVSFDIMTEDFLIPALSVQPLIENAIKHGLMKLSKGGTVKVSSYETDSDYCVSVEDNGVGFDTSMLLDEKMHIGFRNIRTRVEIMCRGSVHVESSPESGTNVLIIIPKETS